MHIWPLPNLTKKDVALGIFDTQDPKIGNFLICSVYWNILDREVPPLFKEAVKFANNNGYIVLASGDI